MEKLQSPDDCKALLFNCQVLGLPGQELATCESNRILFSQQIMLTEDSPKAPVRGIRLEDVGFCGVSDLQEWCTREVILKSLESSFLVVTPVHLVGLTLSGEVGQGCCNCRKTRNELAVVANKTQEGTIFLLNQYYGRSPRTLGLSDHP